MVCRCPECGRFHSAGHRTTATSVWLGRFAGGLLLLWVLIIASAFLLAGITFGAIQFTHIDLYTYMITIGPDGRRVMWSQNAAGSTYVYEDDKTPAVVSRSVYTLVPPTDPRYRFNRGWEDLILINLLSIGSGFAAGVLLVVILWHWQKRRYGWVLAVPLIASACVLGTIYLFSDYDFIRGWATRRVLYHAALQCASISLGILLGRPIARAVVRIFIPPRPRQYLAFLWRADGKPMPLANLRT